MPKKRMMRLVVVLMFFLIPGICLGADIAKIGVLDFKKILQDTKAGDYAKKQMSKKLDVSKADLGKREIELKALKEKIERDAMVMSKEKRQEAERDFRIKAMDIRDSEKKYQDELKRLEFDHMSRMQKEVAAILEEYCKKNQYLLVVEKTSALYYPKANDITESIIKIYNQRFKPPK
ncbi:OmpH family outer membrane protein [Desulfobacterales bacterium HSG17]|nr:OmpH family outer membrane protein [Desulfobacterales bacterium HSG17]